MRSIRALNVAEKPSVAKAITDILSSRNATKRTGKSPYNPIFEFDYDIKGQQVHMVVTSVTGHMMNYAYPPEYKSWERVDPVALFDAPVHKVISEEKVALKKTLEAEIRGCQWLILWLDCDREGENIAFEVVSVCKEANPRINTIFRAHFSALIPAEIHRACQNLAKPNELDSLAVDARQELDLRIGAAFTRFQTMRFRNKFTGISETVSYGPCQFPTLGFIVDRYWKHKVFKPEDYWGIKVVIDKDDQSASLNWDRKRLFDHASVLILYELCVDNPTATVVQVNSKPTRKYRPFPLTTVQLQKLCAQKLKISSDDTMEIAERLYQQGFISYPRTETSKFSPNTDFRSLINVQKDDPVWGDYARKLLDQGFKNPKPGKTDDNSHPPIHPTKHAHLDGRDKAVYELIVRHFLACCSDDALGQETTVEISIAGEMFHCKGLAITAYNFLEIYRYEKWSDKTIPNFKKGEQYLPSVLEMYHDKTTAPSCLTESELIQLMYDNGIGTDATIAEHIKKVLQRQYCIKQGARGEFIPTKLGEALVAGYNAIGFRKLSLPQLRAQMELDMKGIGNGAKTKEQVVKENISVYKDIYVKVEQQARLLDEALGRYYQPLGSNFTDEQREFAQCGKCQNMMHLRNTGQKQVLYCEHDQLSLVVPNGELQPTSVLCPLCNFQAVSATSAKGKAYNICPYCYNNPPSLPDIEEGGRQNSKMPCFECSADCQFAGRQQSIMPCPQCGSGFTVKRKKDGGVFLGCSGYPNCTKTLWLPSELESVSVTSEMCPKCAPKQCRKLNLKFHANRVIPGDPTELVACVGGCDPNISEYLAMANKNFNTFYDKDPAAAVPPYFQQGMRPTPEPKRTSAAVNIAYEELAGNVGASNKRPTYNNKSTNTNYSNNNYSNYQTNNQWNSNSNNNQSFNSNRNQSGSHYVQDVDQDDDYNSYNQENQQSYSDSYNGPVGDFPEPFDPSEISRTCECQRPAVMKRVVKNSANKGKAFWVCENGVCNFFEWDDSAPSGSRSGGASKRGRGAGYGDRGGNKRGSWSKSTYGSRGQSSRDRGTGSPKKATSRTCSACGQTGHTKRSCPSLKNQSDY